MFNWLFVRNEGTRVLLIPPIYIYVCTYIHICPLREIGDCLLLDGIAKEIETSCACGYPTPPALLGLGLRVV